jgi:tryptophanyl-tRNA synthetase
MKALMAEPDVIDDILAKGSERAAAIASKVMDDVRDIVGFIQSRKRR